MRNLKKPLYIIGAISLLLACRQEKYSLGTESDSLNVVEIKRIQMNPDSYDQMTIETTGHFNYTFENVAIYPERFSDPNEAIWVDFNDVLGKSLSESILNELHERKLRVQGRFSSADTGHLGLFIGTITIDFLETVD